ncbi:putative ABC exporter domain-containing protein [Miniphocaeibacter massiliensis]|uniref:putative ABC exporter domain-containing protein n=1 Tax=Miniphocaeibacter massiliensis TaxID=2041841 RepID=UPI000C1C3068|nr:putative ABC exporter domain-containing protein [Miniphocaeibacter massiliensis]
MNKAFEYYFKTITKNRIKNLRRKPIKSIGMILLAIYFVFLPFMFKNMVVGAKLDNPKGYIAFIAVVSIYLGMPSIISYFKRKGLIFTESEVNFMFTAPISPKQNIMFAMGKTLLISTIQYASFFVAAFFIFKIPLIKAILITILGFVFTITIDYSLGIIMYGSEKLSNKTKDRIKYFVYIILLALTGMIVKYLFDKGFSFSNAIDFLSGDLIMIIPIFGWEIGVLKLILIEPTIYNILASAMSFLTSVTLLRLVLRMKSTGEYYEDALSFSEEYSKAINESKRDGSASWVGKKNKIKNIEFSKKGTYSKAIFYKQLDEFKKMSFLKKYIKVIIYLLVSTIVGFLIREDNKNLEVDFGLALIAAYIVSIYFGLFFSKSKRWRAEYDNFYIYLFPDSSRNKMFYATLLQNLVTVLEALALAIPVNIIFKLPVYFIITNTLIYISVQMVILYMDYILREIIGSKIGESITYFIMLGIDFLILGLIGGATFLIYYLTDSTLGSFLVGISLLSILSFIGLMLSSKLYTNMEFVNN